LALTHRDLLIQKNITQIHSFRLINKRSLVLAHVTVLKFDNMAIEIFGFTIGEIAAIAALIASPLIFLVGYNRTRKSEQIKIARDIADRIELKSQEASTFAADNSLLWPSEDASLEARSKTIYTYQILFSYMLSEIEYFSHLMETKEIDDKILIDYYRHIVSSKLLRVADFCDQIRLWLKEDDKALGQSPPFEPDILMKKTEFQEARVKKIITTWRIQDIPIS
jgi:hypothetical protein